MISKEVQNGGIYIHVFICNTTMVGRHDYGWAPQRQIVQRGSKFPRHTISSVLNEEVTVAITNLFLYADPIAFSIGLGSDNRTKQRKFCSLEHKCTNANIYQIYSEPQPSPPTSRFNKLSSSASLNCEQPEQENPRFLWPLIYFQ
jgi:hypothetical protein